MICLTGSTMETAPSTFSEPVMKSFCISITSRVLLGCRTALNQVEVLPIPSNDFNTSATSAWSTPNLLAMQSVSGTSVGQVEEEEEEVMGNKIRRKINPSIFSLFHTCS